MSSIAQRESKTSARNNFEILRWIAATAVILGHAYGLQGQDGWYSKTTKHDLGWSAVIMFFTISGYLIQGSVSRRTHLEFWLARILRIFPGLLVCTLSTAVVLSFLSDVSAREFFTNTTTLRYMFGSGLLLANEYYLPGVFGGAQVNGSLWTLRYEIASYAILFSINYAGILLRLRLSVIIKIVAIFLILDYVFIYRTGEVFETSLLHMSQLFIPFCIGAWISCARIEKFSGIFALGGVGLATVFSGTLFATVSMEIAIASFTLWAAFLRLEILDPLRQIPDFSYGIYVYAFPIQMALIEFLPNVAPGQKAIYAFLIVLLPASLSWYLIEKPAMGLRKKIFKDQAVSGPKFSSI